MRLSYIITNSLSLQETPAHHPAGERQLPQVPSREASSPSSGRRPGKSSSPSPGTGPLPQRLRPPAQSCSVQAPCSQSARGRIRLPNRGIPAPPWQGRSSDSALPAGEARRARCRCRPTLRSRGLGGALSSAWAQVGVRVGEQGPFPQRNTKTLLPGLPRCCRPTPSGARKSSVSGQ